MGDSKSADIDREAVLMAAKLMAAAARTAPKSRGLDSIKTLILSEREQLENLAKAMEERYKEDPDNLSFFKRNAEDVRNSMAVLLLGVTGEPVNLNCGACGYRYCSDFLKAAEVETEDAKGPLCIFKAIDLGIALGSAVKTAAIHNIDNRVMFSIGSAARRLKLLPADFIIGIALTATGKNVYFTGR